jgi:hypothetical protein
VNPLVLRLIIALAPTIERLLIALIERWLSERAKAQPFASTIDPASDKADEFLEELQSLERVAKKEDAP